MRKKTICLMMILMFGIMMLTGCKIRNYDSYLISVNKDNDGIKLGYANFVFKYNQARYDVNYGDTYGVKLWTEDMTGSGSTFADEVKNNIVETLETQYVIKKHADEFNVTISDEEKNKIDEAAKKFMEENSSSTLNSLGADESVVKEMLTDATYVSKIEKALENRGKADGSINENNTAATYINGIVEGWKNEVEFTVDDSLLQQITVDDLYKASTSNSTNSSNSSKGSN